MSIFTRARTMAAAALVFAALEVGGTAGAALPAPPLTIGTVTIADGTAVVNGSRRRRRRDPAHQRHACRRVQFRRLPGDGGPRRRRRPRRPRSEERPESPP